MLSNEYFKADLKAVYRHLRLPCAAILAAACVYFYILVFIMDAV